MNRTLEIIRAEHEASAAHIRTRPRSESERAAFRRLVSAKRRAWEAAGGAPADFALAGVGAELEGQAEAPAAETPSSAEASAAPSVEGNSTKGEPRRSGRRRRGR